MDLFNQIRKKLVIFVHFKGFNISQKPNSSPLSYFAQKISLNLAPNWYPIICTCSFRSHSCSYISNIDISVHSEIAILILSMSLNFIKAWRNDKYNKIVLIWRFTLVLIKINYGQIGDQTGLFHTTNPIFYTIRNKFVHRTGTFGNLIFSLIPSDNRNTRSTCPTSVFTGIGQTLMSRPVVWLLFAQRFITIFNCRYHTSNHLSVCHKPTSLSPINCQLVDNCIIINTLINHHDPIYL